MEHVPCEHCQDPPRGVEGPRDRGKPCPASYCEQRAEVRKHSSFHINFMKKQHEMRHPDAAAVLFATNTHPPLPSCDEKRKSFDAK